MNLLAILCWLLNAVGIIAAWAQSAPLSGFMAAAAVAGMVGSALWAAEDVWPSLKRNAK